MKSSSLYHGISQLSHGRRHYALLAAIYTCDPLKSTKDVKEVLKICMGLTEVIEYLRLVRANTK